MLTDHSNVFILKTVRDSFKQDVHDEQLLYSRIIIPLRCALLIYHIINTYTAVERQALNIVSLFMDIMSSITACRGDTDPIHGPPYMPHT